MSREKQLTIALLTEKLQNLTGKKVVLRESINIDVLEQEYKNLKPFLKDVIPTNIKEWLLVKNQYERLELLTKEVEENPDAVLEKYSTLFSNLRVSMSKIWEIILGGDPYKHSLQELAQTAEVLTPAKSDYFNKYLNLGRVDIDQCRDSVQEIIFLLGKAFEHRTKRQQNTRQVYLHKTNLISLSQLNNISSLILDKTFYNTNWTTQEKELIPIVLNKSKVIIDKGTGFLGATPVRNKINLEPLLKMGIDLSRVKDKIWRVELDLRDSKKENFINLAPKLPQNSIIELAFDPIYEALRSETFLKFVKNIVGLLKQKRNKIDLQNHILDDRETETIKELGLNPDGLTESYLNEAKGLSNNDFDNIKRANLEQYKKLEKEYHSIIKDYGITPSNSMDKMLMHLDPVRAKEARARINKVSQKLIELNKINNN